MKLTFTRSELQVIRARHQGLSEASRAKSASAIVSNLVALQSQEWLSAQLALHARADSLTQADAQQARESERAFVLTWALRGTLHLVAAEDLRWMIALCGPGAIRGSKGRYQQLGLTERAREAALEAIDAILSRDGALTRSELALGLAERGIPVEGQAIHHLLRFAALRGLICLGPKRGRDLTYVLLDDWLPAETAEAPPADPLAIFARRYLAAYAPATAEDFARWSGLSRAQVKAAWATIVDDCISVLLPSGEALMLKAQLERPPAARADPTLRLLPRYDNYPLGYASRDFMVAEAFAKQVHPGGGLIRACVLIDGEARASWKLEKRRSGLRVNVAPYEALSPPELEQLQAETKSLGRFLNQNAELQVASD